MPQGNSSRKEEEERMMKESISPRQKGIDRGVEEGWRGWRGRKGQSTLISLYLET